MVKTLDAKDNDVADQAYRIERDSMGEVQVPADALYGAQTQRAVENFPGQRPAISTHVHSRARDDQGRRRGSQPRPGPARTRAGGAIQQAAQKVEEGVHDAHFPLDIFQTGSGTSTNMNANEVIATLATRLLGRQVHPNDHVNMSQSSNDVIPTAIHVSAYLEATEHLIPPWCISARRSIDEPASSITSSKRAGPT